MADESWIREYQDGELVPGTPYQVVSLLGAGGMGSVYVVQHIELGRKYVLKSLLRSLASREDLILRMRNEWRALGKLHHPNIVDVVNAGATPDGVPYYVMELLNGETVRDRLARRGKFPIDEAVRIAQGTLVGVAAAHAIGVVHRDIKPANVFLARDGGVKVLDFGIAQVRLEGAPKITQQGLAIGTPRYMSPEQASGEKADARSDVYAVGLLLYEMLAGEGPFDDLSDVTQQMLAHLHRPPRPLTLWADVPDELVEIVERALAKNPEDRPRSAEYMAVELAPFAGVEPSTRRARASRPSFEPPGFALISSPTPSGIVLNTTPPSDVKLNPTWHDETLERGSNPPKRTSVVPADELDVVPNFRGRPGRRALKWGVVGLLVAGGAIASLGLGSAEKAVRAAPLAAEATTATMTTTTTTTTTTNPTTSANPLSETAAPSASGAEGKPSASRAKKRAAKPGAASATADDKPVRLPPSGL